MVNGFLPIAAIFIVYQAIELAQVLPDRFVAFLEATVAVLDSTSY